MLSFLFSDNARRLVLTASVSKQADFDNTLILILQFDRFAILAIFFVLLHQLHFVSVYQVPIAVVFTLV